MYNTSVFRLLATCLLVCLLFSATRTQAQTPPDVSRFTGTWIGTAEMEPYPELFMFLFDSTLYVRLFYNEIEPHEPESFQINGDSLFVQIEKYDFQGSFRGRKEADTLKGVFSYQGGQFPCYLIRVDPSAVADIGELTGVYDFGNSHYVQLEPFFLDFTLAPLMMLDYKTGKKRVAFPTDATHYITGKKMLTPYPVDVAFSVVRDETGEFRALEYYDFGSGRVPEKGRKLPFLSRTEEITARNGKIELGATFTWPLSDGPYPLVIFVPGAGEQYRGAMLDDYVRMLPYFGIATLTYDKRGCGQSGGELSGSTFEDLAADLNAIIRRAARHKNVRPEQIGLLGIDQAGYIMPLALSKPEKDRPMPRFMVSLSGAAVGLEEQEYQALSLRMKADGFASAQVEEATAYMKLMFQYLRKETDSVKLAARSADLERKPWAAYVTSFSNKPYIEWWSKHHAFHPKTYFDKLQIPVLAIYGEKDVLLPPATNVPVMEKYIKKIAGKPGAQDSKVLVLPGANHYLMLGERRGDFQFSELEGYAPDLFPTLHEWITERFGLGEK